MPADVLAAIVAGARRSADERAHVTSLDVLRERAAARTATTPGFATALAAPGVRVIAECKRRSPSRGVLRDRYDPAAIARAYGTAGAAAISVLTEPAFFDGSLAHLEAVRSVVSLPLLRKDFVVTEYQVIEAAAFGADAVLLIAAALDDQTLVALVRCAAVVGLDALVEVHDRDELRRALDAGAAIVGVNSRNLRTLQVDLTVFDDLAPLLPAETLAVAESGLRTGADIRRLRDAGYRAFLIGERFMLEPDPGAALRVLLDEAGR